MAQLYTTVEYLYQTPSIDIQDLNFTMNRRRTVFSVKVSFAAQSTQDLSQNIQQTLKAAEENPDRAISIRSSSTKLPTVLNIFTGQGAQYAEIGANLLQYSASARRRYKILEHSLTTLP